VPACQILTALTEPSRTALMTAALCTTAIPIRTNACPRQPVATNTLIVSVHATLKLRVTHAIQTRNSAKVRFSQHQQRNTVRLNVARGEHQVLSCVLMIAQDSHTRPALTTQRDLVLLLIAPLVLARFPISLARRLYRPRHAAKRRKCVCSIQLKNAANPRMCFLAHSICVCLALAHHRLQARLP